MLSQRGHHLLSLTTHGAHLDLFATIAASVATFHGFADAVSKMKDVAMTVLKGMSFLALYHNVGVPATIIILDVPHLRRNSTLPVHCASRAVALHHQCGAPLPLFDRLLRPRITARKTK